VLTSLCNIALLCLASLRVNATSLTGVINTSEATSSPAVNVAAVDQVHTTNRSALGDTVGGIQNPTDESRRGTEEALKTYRELAEKEPETYLPNVAATLNDLGILDSDENRIEKARKEFEEALKIYRQLAHKEPDIYLRYLAVTLNNLGVFEGAGNRLEEALKIYRELAHKERETFLPYVAITLNNLGILDSGKNRVNKARQEYAESLKIYRELAQKKTGDLFTIRTDNP
jgi:tetratricopeptide (TPR) repeat protein